MARRCFYEVLGVERQIGDDELKKAYRKQALQWHPDKNSSPNAQKTFQSIQEAYEVLSDPHERAWYDSHRSQILGRSSEDDYGESISVWPYFSRQCFGAFDDSADGFYTVYRNVFNRIHASEVRGGQETHKRAGFGNESSSWATEVAIFYRDWEDFRTQSDFSYAAKWNLADAANREVRRLMDADNKKAIREAKKGYSEEVRRLVQYVKRRDPRYQSRQRQLLREAAEKQEQMELARQKQIEITRLARLEARKRELERQEEFRRYREELKANGQAFTPSDDEEEALMVPESWIKCDLCRKRFKSERQLEAHLKSKKHQQVAKKSSSFLQNKRLPAESKTSEELEVNASDTDENQETDKRDHDYHSGHAKETDEDAVEEKSTLDDSRPDHQVEITSSNDYEAEIDHKAYDTYSSEDMLSKNGPEISRKDEERSGCAEVVSEKTKSATIKKPRRRAKTTEEKAVTWKCLVCEQIFASRNKLFGHIKTEGHAAPKGQSRKKAS